MTRNEKTAAIRKELKKHGWNSRQVSVRGRSCTYSSAIDVRVRDPKIPLAVVERIANEHADVRRCEVTGDILMGGNTYVSVSYEAGALDPYVAAVLTKMGDTDYIETCGYTISKETDGHGWWYSRNDEPFVHRCWGKEEAVRGMVRDVLSAAEA